MYPPKKSYYEIYNNNDDNNSNSINKELIVNIPKLCKHTLSSTVIKDIQKKNKFTLMKIRTFPFNYQ